MISADVNDSSSTWCTHWGGLGPQPVFREAEERRPRRKRRQASVPEIEPTAISESNAGACPSPPPVPPRTVWKLLEHPTATSSGAQSAEEAAADPERSKRSRRFERHILLCRSRRSWVELENEVVMAYIVLLLSLLTMMYVVVPFDIVLLPRSKHFLSVGG